MTTLIILLLDKKEDNGIVLTIGDGLICINGKITEYDHDNTPDYIGYHLSKNFDFWYQNHQQKLLIDSIQDITIATDGIFSFTKWKIIDSSIELTNPPEYLAINKDLTDNPEMLNLKMKKLENTFGLKPTDDLAF